MPAVVCATQPFPVDLAASYRFLISDRAAGGILYTASAGVLQGRQLPLSFVDSAAYWGEHVCTSADCTVTDIYNPSSFALNPATSLAGDLQTERINTHNGANIYDAATWQIAVMLGYSRNRLPLAPGQDAYTLVGNQNLLLAAGHSGDSRYPFNGETRAVTNGATFVYNQLRITEPDRAFSFRMLPRNWLSLDPFSGTQYGRLITATGLPPLNPDYQVGRASWSDWKPIIGENAWAFLIGPLQAAALHSKGDGALHHVSFRDPALRNAVTLLPTFAAMQSRLGAVYYAPAGTVANQGTQLVDPFFVAVENNLSLYAGLHILQSTLNTTLLRDKELNQGDRAAIIAALKLSTAMLDGGAIGGERRTAGLRSFFKEHAWRNGEFVQGGQADSPTGSARWLPSLSPKAVDVNTWGIAALGPKNIDDWFGFGASYHTWQRVKGWGGYGQGKTLWGVGFSDLDGNGIDSAGNYRQGILSVEWTAGAITMVRAMLDHYQNLPTSSPHYSESRTFIAPLQADERSMLAAMESLRSDTYAKSHFHGKPKNYEQLFTLSTKPYLYASKRYLIPFGWYANPIPSTCATAWMVMVANRYNPFVPGGGPHLSR